MAGERDAGGSVTLAPEGPELPAGTVTHSLAAEGVLGPRTWPLDARAQHAERMRREPQRNWKGYKII